MQVQINGLEKVAKLLDKLSGEQVREATALALNDAAFKVKAAMTQEIRDSFDRPTPFILRSVRIEPRATASSLIAQVLPTYWGSKTIDPQQVLKAQREGGNRRLKRSEVAFRNAGILPPGYFTAIPKDPFPGSDDGNGNLRGAFVSQLISYFQAAGEQGYKANMTKRRREKLANKVTSPAGFKTIMGVEFFVAYGSLRGGKTGHLAPGIWARQGTHGVNIKPVLMFVRQPTYQRRLDLEKILKSSLAQEHFEKRLRYRIRQMAGV